MEIDKTKCLICEVSCNQKGLAFFKFPKEETRLKMWVKEISPLLDILKVQPNSLKENGRICSRHFKERDFINRKQNSLVRNARPSLSVSNLNINLEINEGSFDQECFSVHDHFHDGNEKDIFQCGRCKTQFEQLSDFIDHKRFRCKWVNKTSNTGTIQKTESPSKNVLNDTSFGEIVRVTDERLSPDSKISLVMKDGFLIENSGGPTQMILTPELCFNNPSSLSEIFVTQSPLGETELEVGDVILTAADCSNRGIVYTQNNNKMIITSQIPTDVLITTEVPNLSNLDHSLNYCKLTNGSHQFDGERKIDVGKPNQTAETEVKKAKAKLPCSYCGKMFEKPFNLQQHERVHTGERPFQCIICGRAFTQKSNVRKHMMRHRVWPKGKQTLRLRSENGLNGDEIDYSCQYCSLSFKSYAEHKKHLIIHSNFKVYRCIQKDCDETFNDLDEFLSHSKMHSSAEFQCHICLKTFTNLEDLGVHQYDHDTTGKDKRKETEIKLKCQVCHARFKTSESLKNHLAVDTHHHACVHCKSVFSSERFLRRHLFTHVDPSHCKFECPNCRKSFRTQQNLKNHMYIHVKEKPFTCDHCDKQFASKYRLKRHVAIHLNQYFECPFKKHLGCDKAFYRKDKLRDHVNTHSHCRLRSCRICPKMYWTLGKLQQHMQRDHKIGERKWSKEVLKCFNCLQTFRKEKQMAQHHCTVEERKAEKKKKGLEAVSNIEIIMMPFGAVGDDLT